jgi:hypothetical protein
MRVEVGTGSVLEARVRGDALEFTLRSGCGSLEYSEVHFEHRASRPSGERWEAVLSDGLRRGRRFYPTFRALALANVPAGLTDAVEAEVRDPEALHAVLTILCS